MSFDVRTLNLDDLNPFEGDRSILLAENDNGFWKGLIFDPKEIVSASEGFLVLQNNQIVLSSGGGGGGAVTLDGVISGSGDVDGTITTSFASPLDLTLGGGRITGLLDEAYSADQAVRKDSIDTWLLSTLNNSKAYTDTQDATTLADSKTYTDTQDAITRGLLIAAEGDVIGDLKLGQANNLTIADKGIALTGPVTGTGSLGGSIATSFAYPIAAGDQRITNVATPTAPTDATSKGYTDTATLTVLNDSKAYTDTEITTTKALSITATGDVTGSLKLGESQPLTVANKNISLSGDVTGTGTLGGTITTSLTYPLDAGSQKLINVGVPTLDTDGATKKYVDDNSGGGGGGTVTLDGVVEGSGAIGGTITTSFQTSLFNINLNGGRLTGINATPAASNEAASKQYVDDRNITLLGSVLGSGPINSSISTTIASPLSLSGSQRFKYSGGPNFTIWHQMETTPTTDPYTVRYYTRYSPQTSNNDNYLEMQYWYEMHNSSPSRKAGLVVAKLRNTTGKSTLFSAECGDASSSRIFNMYLTLYMNNYKIKELGAPVDSTDAATKQYADLNLVEAKSYSDAQVSSFQNLVDTKFQEAKDYADVVLQTANTNATAYTNGQVSTILGYNIGVQKDATASLKLGETKDLTINFPFDTAGGKITGLPIPTGPTDAANKQYVDSQSGGGLPTTVTGDVAGTLTPGTLSTLTLTTPIDAKTARIENVDDPRDGAVGELDAANKLYVDSKASMTLVNAVLNANNYTDAEITTTKALPITATGDVTGTLSLAGSADLKLSDHLYHNFDYQTIDWTTTNSSSIEEYNLYRSTATNPEYKISYHWGATGATFWYVNYAQSSIEFLSSSSGGPAFVIHNDGTLNANDNRFINLANPTSLDDAANKRYVDGLVEKLHTRIGKLEKLNGIKPKKQSFLNKLFKRKNK